MNWNEAIKDLNIRREKSKLGGGESKIAKQHEKGKLTARERLELLFDEGSFVEIDNFVESRIEDFGVGKKRVPGDGVVVGYGKINGRTVFASSEDFTVIGGTLGEYHSAKICHIQDLAYENGAPIIMVNDSGGARIEEGISSLSGYGGIFLRNTKASGVIPQIAVILGPCSGGACYSPALCDFIFMVRKTGKMFITGPQVVKTVLNEDITIDELGGADVHAKKSGVTHFTYDNEQECISGVRKLLEYLPDNCTDKPKELPIVKRRKYIARNPYNKCEEFTSIVSVNSKKPYDVHEIIKRIVDEEDYLEVQKDFAKNAVICFARMNGQAVGIVANQPTYLAGAIDCDASDKMARFIRTCDCYNIPIITLVDVPAFYPGKNQEHNGIIRHGAKMLYAYAEASVPKITLIMRKAYGGAYIAMNSKEMGADIVYAWPIAEIAVMGAEGAVNIIFKNDINKAEDPAKERARLISEYEERFMNPYVAAARGFITEVIDPKESRDKILSALEMLKNKNTDNKCRKHANIPM